MTDTEPTPRAGRREWLGLALIAFPCLVYSMDLTVLNLAVPAMSRDLRPTAAELLWIVDIYGFLVAGGLITMGALGDRIGARRLLLIGAAGFLVTSVVASLSTSALMLIGARAVLGLAGATLAPSTLSLIGTLFRDSQQRTLAIGIWVTSYASGGIIGPLLGGVILQVLPWNAIFLLAVPPMAVLLLLGRRFLPERRATIPGRLDLPSAALSLAAVLAAIAGLKQLATGADPLVAVGWVLLGVLLGWVFGRRQRRLAEPLLDLALFRSPLFSAALAAYVAAAVTIFGMSMLLAQYLQSVLGLSPLVAGLWTLPEAIASTLGSLLAPRVIARLAPSTAVGAGLLLGAVGYGMITAVQGLAPVVIGTTVAGLGVGVVVTLATDVVVGAAPPERVGSASALSETGAEFGGAVGIAVLGSIGTAVFRFGMPAGASDGARDTLAGALDAAASRTDVALADAARAAFGVAFGVASGVSAALLLATAVVAFAVLRSAPARAASVAEPVEG